jgi:peptide/nickel transport system substrate-binding protein
MKHMKPMKQILSTLLLGLLLLTACTVPAAPVAPVAADANTGAGSESASTTVGNTLRIAQPFLSQPLDPAKGGGFNALQFGVGETLMRLDESFAPVPWLAEKMTPLSATEWEIVLRPAVTFHDGTPLDATALKAALERAVEQIATAKTLLDLQTITVKDEHTVLLATQNPSPRLPGILTEPSTAIVNAAAAAAAPDADAFALKPVMTGPFIVESYQIDQEAVLVRYADYWGGAAQAEKVVVSVLADANARMLALQSGQVDLAVDIRPESVEVAKGDPNLRVVPAQPVATMFMYINQQKPQWQPVAVRQALAHAVPERSALVKTVLRGEGIPAVGAIPVSVLPCDGLQPLAPDLAQAKALLAEAGYVDSDGDGIVEKDGAPLTMIVLSYPQRPALTPMAEIIQANFKEIGIALEIQTVEQINDALTNQDWDAGMYFNNMAATGDPYGSFVQFYTEQGSSNRGGYKSATVEAMIADLAPLAERAQRQAKSCEISQQILDDVAIIPLVYPNFNYGASTAVTGFETAHPYFLYLLNNQINRP